MNERISITHPAAILHLNNNTSSHYEVTAERVE